MASGTRTITPVSADGSKAVGAKVGSPLPEHAYGEDETLSLLLRVERCCVESRPAEIEAAVAALSDFLGKKNGNKTIKEGGCSSTSATTSVDSIEAMTAGARETLRGGRDKDATAAFCFGMSQRGGEAKAALSACRAALRLCRAEYEELLRETALFSSTSASPTVTAAFEKKGETTLSSGAEKNIRAYVTGFVVAGNIIDDSDPPAISAAEAVNGGGVLNSRHDGAILSQPPPPLPPATIATGLSGSSAAISGGEGGSGSKVTTSVWRAAEAMWAGAAALGLFLQENYSGPELGESCRHGIDAWFTETIMGADGGSDGNGSGDVDVGMGESGDTPRATSTVRNLANVALACDGELPYPRSNLVGSLLLARTILTALARATKTAATTAPITMTATTPGVGKQPGAATTGKPEDEEGVTFRRAVSVLSSADWWSARACVAHARLLLSSDRSETLWREAIGLFDQSVRLFGGGVSPPLLPTEEGKGEKKQSKLCEGAFSVDSVRRRVAGQVWLEWGLAQHYFQVRVDFVLGKVRSGCVLLVSCPALFSCAISCLFCVISWCVLLCCLMLHIALFCCVPVLSCVRVARVFSVVLHCSTLYSLLALLYLFLSCLVLSRTLPRVRRASQGRSPPRG